MKVLNDILGYKNLKIYQDSDFFCFSLDSVILANYSNIRPNDKKICDLGTGNGVIPLILSQRTKSNIYCVEIQTKLYNLAKESFKYNHLDNQITIYNCDIDDKINFPFTDFFDLVLCNPPYFKLEKKSLVNISVEKQIARHEVKMNLEKLFKVTSNILKTGGNVCVVHRPERLIEILDIMRKYNIEPKKIKMVFQNIESSSKLVLIEGQKGGNPGLKVESPLIMYDSTGQMTEEYFKLMEEVRK